MPPTCVIPSDGLSLMDNPNCLFSSVCGMEGISEGTSDWVTLSNSTEHSFEVCKSSNARTTCTSLVYEVPLPPVGDGDATIPRSQRTATKVELETHRRSASACS